ncbi:MAG: pyruvate ferredoxin oxidoreductase [Candidatus Helarchaeota archaeon]|nr:pyruvate ferredoxin oxidoreductase [Candidatus Helarchaeota archaeon]
MGNIVALNGNDAVGTAMKQINPDVVAAFPITPQTELMHKFADFVANGEVDTEFVLVESEHSAMSAVIGASASGARAMTATSACGFALMWEVLYVAASCRLPIVMAVVNRALSANINIHCDHSDTMGGRDTGWIQIYSENTQEAYDNTIQAVRIAENPNLLLPVMITLDGFILSHTTETLNMLDDKDVRDWIGEYNPKHSLLDIKNPITVGPLDLQDYYFEHKRQQAEIINNSYDVIVEVGKEYGKLTGREYGLFEEYMMEDAEIVAIVLGSTAGTTKEAVDILREEGIKAGMIKLRVFRPFPYKELKEVLSNLKVISVLDRCISFGAYGGPVFNEIKAALYGIGDPPEIINYIYGLGGRDISIEEIKSVYYDMKKISEGGKVKEYVNYLGVRE